MPATDPVDDFRAALERLTDLRTAVAAQDSFEEVADAMTQLRLAVARAYGGRRIRNPRGRGASRSILEYLTEHLGEWVYGEELAAVSGIGEWARRVRELRVESGYEIEESQGRYRLTAREPDITRRDRWQLVTEIREWGGSPEDRVSGLLERLVGQTVHIDELDRVARAKQGARIVRDLRSREGWPIEGDGDAADLRAGEYRLASALSWHRLPPEQALFPEDLRRDVFSRDRFKCWTCSHDRGDAVLTSEEPFFLLVRHLDAAPAQLRSLPAQALADLTRLATSCNRCYH